MFLSLRAFAPPWTAGKISSAILSNLSITSDDFLMASGAPIPNVILVGGSRDGEPALKLERNLLWNLMSWGSVVVRRGE